jgi:hypothetical protein
MFDSIDTLLKHSKGDCAYIIDDGIAARTICEKYNAFHATIINGEYANWEHLTKSLAENMPQGKILVLQLSNPTLGLLDLFQIAKDKGFILIISCPDAPSLKVSQLASVVIHCKAEFYHEQKLPWYNVHTLKDRYLPKRRDPIRIKALKGILG